MTYYLNTDCFEMLISINLTVNFMFFSFLEMALFYQ